MKTAIYIEDGLTQVVLTPESDAETSAMRLLQGQNNEVKLIPGSFYGCNGGYVRHNPGGFDDKSIIITVRPRQEVPEAV